MKCIEDEIPFDVPDNWEWCRLECICPYGETESVDSSQIEEDSWILDLEDIEKETGRIIYFATKAERDAKSNKHRFLAGQLLYSKLRPYLNKVVIAPRNGFCTSEILPLKLYGNISPEYMQCFLMSDTFLAYVNLISYGLKMPRLGTNDGKKAIIALPPLSEQKRIVEKCHDAFEEIAILQSDRDDLENVIISAKSKILDLAIRGKLVPQDPNDEPSSVLLERIRVEKEDLIKQGKLKRDKKESIIYKGDDNSYYENMADGTATNITNEIPFMIPESWSFIRLCNLFELISGRDLTPTEYNDVSSGIPYITGASNFTDGKVNINRWTTVPQVKTKVGDLLVTCKGTVGELSINEFGEAHIARQIMAIRNPYAQNINYLKLCIAYYVETLKHKSKGLIPGISREDILYLLIPIAPINEQQRIVQTVESYINLTDSIKASLQ